MRPSDCKLAADVCIGFPTSKNLKWRLFTIIIILLHQTCDRSIRNNKRDQTLQCGHWPGHRRNSPPQFTLERTFTQLINEITCEDAFVGYLTLVYGREPVDDDDDDDRLRRYSAMMRMTRKLNINNIEHSFINDINEY